MDQGLLAEFPVAPQLCERIEKAGQTYQGGGVRLRRLGRFISCIYIAPVE
jgi:hypothetical protein